jgi:hypothetical protein
MKKYVFTFLILLTQIAFAFRVELNPSLKSELIGVLQANEKLHMAFFKSDYKKAEYESKNVISAIDKISDANIKSMLKFAQTKLSQIKSNQDKKVNNKNYHIVSSALIFLLNKYDLGSGYNAYSCPMVKMKWIQNSKKINKVHNPYANEMPHCGEKDSDY